MAIFKPFKAVRASRDKVGLFATRTYLSYSKNNLIDKIKKTIYHIVYFYYVGIVMAVTYLARIKGEFVGAPTELFHYFGFSIVILIYILFGYKMFRKS